ncbi:Spy/CpxP family protein refolding chaperone [Stieleria sp. TO1_6]|uniref:Spy/CpxP family protein refolding chaperone n=1 Tax=Stieleria tagensis TaxID=2956795 RepID=UPI00209AC5BC|nr:Spy/CpxP family protein refolding chaperone [Stieleria tagensis]MCO8125275.1 Spy/CpxP family protein refolding chaperone [Stieleria tagensis]
MKSKVLGLAIALMLTTVVVADDADVKKKKKGAQAQRNPAANVLKQLKDVDLTDEQKTKIDALAKKSMAEMQTLRKEAGLTPELMKQRTAAQKEFKDSDKKPNEIFAAVNEKLGLNEAQVAALKKVNESRTELLKNSVALLSEEQQAKLPKRILQMSKGKPEGKGKGKKKKEAQ